MLHTQQFAPLPQQSGNPTQQFVQGGGPLPQQNANTKIKLHYGVARVIGSRTYQEDEYTCIDNLSNNNGAAYFAIFDGHASDAYSAHASNNTHKFIFESESFQKGDYTSAILEGLKKEDDELFDKFHKVELGGSTATVCLIVGNKLYLGNLGDSSSVLAVNEGGVLKGYRISKDHKPDDPQEKARIEAAGGHVVGDRVVGPSSAINMSRAIGDFTFKMPLNRQQGDWIASMPHLIDPITITQNTPFLILASDGLWNVMGNRAVQVVNELKNKGFRPDDIAKIMAHECGCVPHADNTTVIVVFFDFEGNLFQNASVRNPNEPLISVHSVEV
eukprot:Phypoly_transcript_10825.p1 GENE.Phypoly_transcript_10825~~Phypoly_transcript_10825.p1  ORF type:complete len:330 (+),score=54.17 Phypoly_transcript_10825:147-1136(+)